MIFSTPKMVLILALAFVAGCGSEADMMGVTGAMTDADVAAQVDGGGTGGAQGTGGSMGMVDAGAGKTDVMAAATGGAGGSAPGTGGAAGGAGGSIPAATGGAPGTGGGAMGGAGGAGGAPVEIMYCPEFPGLTRGRTGYLNADQTRTSRWKNGYECVTCTADKPVGVVSGCLLRPRPGLEIGPNLCVKDAAECCYQKAGSPCATNADCCTGLTCQPTGNIKTCR